MLFKPELQYNVLPQHCAFHRCDKFTRYSPFCLARSFMQWLKLYTKLLISKKNHYVNLICNINENQHLNQYIYIQRKKLNTPTQLCMEDGLSLYNFNRLPFTKNSKVLQLRFSSCTTPTSI